MSRRRTTGFFIIALLLLALVAGGFYLRQTWQQLMYSHGIQSLEWEGVDLSFNGLTVARFEVSQAQQGRQLRVEASSLSLGWHWQGFRLTTLSVDTLHLDWQNSSADPDTASPIKLPEIALRWLPYNLTIHSFHATVPCATGRCDLEGALSATRGADLMPVEAVLDLEHEGHLVQIEGYLAGQSLEDLSLSAAVTIDDKPHIELESRYRTATGNQQTGWSGSVLMPELPRADWLLAWLQNWHPMSVSVLPAQPDNASMKASWELTASTGTDFFQSLSGDLTVSANLPQPWPIPGIAAAQGRIELALTAIRGHWQATSADADLKLRNPGSWTRQLPEFLRPHTLDIKIRPPDAVPDVQQIERFLALNLSIISRGQARVDINSPLAIATTKPWAVQMDETRIEVNAPELNAGEWTLRKVALGISVSGQADEREMTLVLGPESSLDIGGITNLDVDSAIQFGSVQADLSQISVMAGYNLEEKILQRWSVKGPLTLASAEVSHPVLRPQLWRFNGALDSDARHFRLAGQLKSRAGASADIDLAYPFDGDLTVTGKLVMDGEASAQTLADTLAVWPQSLEIASGQVSAHAVLRLPVTGPVKLDAQMSMSSVSGSINRTAWTALKGDVDIGLQGSKLAIEVPELSVEQVSSGIPSGPMGMAGSYSGSTADPFSGQLTLERASAGFLGGSLEVSRGTWNLADLPLRVPVELSRVELSELMRVYPAEGLAGTGTLTGQIPLLIDRDGIRVEQGKVSAINPGGTLRLPADRLRGIAQGNRAMELVASAMENFHYSVLNSTIDYDQDGRLFLGLHLEGSNPSVRDGYPIVLNINLEEDIPALLTSLQLSGRVNEAVTERVRELVQKREAVKGDAKVEN